MRGWAWQLTVFATQRRLAEEPMVYVLPSCRSSVFPYKAQSNWNTIALYYPPITVGISFDIPDTDINTQVIKTLFRLST